MEAPAFPNLAVWADCLGRSAASAGGLLDNVVSSDPTEVDKGNQILGQIFGSKDGSRAVAASAAAQSGLQPSLLKKMLPILAMVAAGYVMKQAGQRRAASGACSAAAPLRPATLAAAAQPQASGSGDILRDLIGAAGRFLGR